MRAMSRDRDSPFDAALDAINDLPDNPYEYEDEVGQFWVDGVEMLRQCASCPGVFELTDEHFYRDEARPGYFKIYCKRCYRERELARRRQYAERDPEYYRNERIRQKYGLTPGDYAQMLAEQNEVCAICGETERPTRAGVVNPLSVDHCHETGQVRGLLCRRCNSAAGMLEDCPERIGALRDYIVKWKDIHAGIKRAA